MASFDLNVSQEWLSISKLHKLLADHKLDKESNSGEAIIAKRKKGPPIKKNCTQNTMLNLKTQIQSFRQILPYALIMIIDAQITYKHSLSFALFQSLLSFHSLTMQKSQITACKSLDNHGKIKTS